MNQLIQNTPKSIKLIKKAKLCSQYQFQLKSKIVKNCLISGFNTRQVTAIKKINPHTTISLLYIHNSILKVPIHLIKNPQNLQSMIVVIYDYHKYQIMSFVLRGVFESLATVLENAILQVGRNSRFPKPANHGARPCSSVMRRLRKKQYYKRWKPKTPLDTEDLNPNN